VLLVVTLLVLGAFVVAGAAGADGTPFAGGTGHGVVGVLQSAGLLFFAFAGYARVATLGEEVRDPARTIPRAVTLALALTVLLYAAVALTLLTVLGAAGTAASDAPLAAAAARASAAWAEPLVRVGAAVASLGALLALVAGVGRTVLAMAREGDLPRPLAAVHPRYRVPHRAEVVLALVVAALVLAVDVRGAIGFSSFGVLVYYLVANAAAWTQPAAERRYPRWLQAVGVLGCALLAVSLPVPAVTGGVVVLVVGVGLRRALRQTGFGKP
jgi:APA family basic amino acid/polyamine antiporter